MSMFGTANIRNLMSAAPRTRLGIASDIINMVRTISTLLGTLATGTSLTLRLQYHHGSRVDPSLVPPADFVQSMQDLFFVCGDHARGPDLHLTGTEGHRSEAEIQPEA